MTTDQTAQEDAAIAVPLVRKMDIDHKHSLVSAEPTVRGMALPDNPLIDMDLVDMGLARPPMKMSGVKTQATLTPNGLKVRRHLLREGL